MNTSPLPPPSTKVSPARLTASETLELPRWGLIALCLLYIVPGLIGRDPWKSEDAIAFGAMQTMATGAGHGGVADWLLPNVYGAPVLDSGPLMYWVGALCIRLFGGLLGADLAARIATVAFFFVTVTCIWYATYLVGRRPAAQPAALAFGGHPAPNDYGRLLGDGALLILLATTGLLIRAHESSSDVAMLAMLSLALYGMARCLDQPMRGAAPVGLAIAGLLLSRGPAPAIAISALWAALVALHPDYRPARRAALLVTLPVAAGAIALWPIAVGVLVPDAGVHIGAWFAHWRQYFDGIDAQALTKYVRTLPWATWIAWPMAAWSLWTWRRRLAAAHIALPGGFTIAMLLVLLSTSDTSDGQLLLVLPGLVMLAALGLPTLRRGAANAFDWFSLILYSIAAVFVWFAWFARMTGIPGGFSRSMARLVPGSAPEFSAVMFVLALVATGAWIYLVRWRITTHPRVLWRSVVLASGGLILAWMLTATLFLHAINYGRTYREVATELAVALRQPPAPTASTGASTRNRTRAPARPVVDPAYADAPGGSCIATDGLGLAQRASFAWFRDLRFSKVDYAGANLDECDWLLQQDQSRGRRTATLPPGRWTLVWEGRRPADRDERFRLYRKAGAGSTRGAGDAVDREPVRLQSPSSLPSGSASPVELGAPGEPVTTPAGR